MANTGEKTHELNAERLKYWLSVGAQPSDTVKNMLAKIELVDAGVIAARRTKRIEAKKANEAKKAAIAASAKKEEKK
jgi:ribosomal protein S16